MKFGTLVCQSTHRPHLRRDEAFALKRHQSIKIEQTAAQIARQLEQPTETPKTRSVTRKLRAHFVSVRDRV